MLLILRVIHERASFSSSFFFNQRFQNCAARLVVRAPAHVHITPILRQLHWLSVRARISYRQHASVSTPSPPPLLLISLTFYTCTLLLDLFAPVPTPASSKIHSISARQKVIVLSLTLVLQFRTHCHCALEMLHYRHLQVCSKNLSLQPPRIFLAHICLICSVCGVWCACVWMRARERGSESVQQM